MDASHHSLAVLLTLAGLIGATIEYGELVRRRAMMRARADQFDLDEWGLRGLVRVFVQSDPS